MRGQSRTFVILSHKQLSVEIHNKKKNYSANEIFERVCGLFLLLNFKLLIGLVVLIIIVYDQISTLRRSIHFSIYLKLSVKILLLLR
jgi:uncharacterized membrane protein YqjE